MTTNPKMKTPTWLLIAALLCGGCTSMHRPADYGPPPKDIEERATAWLVQNLDDPYSASFRFGPLQKAWFASRFMRHSGWVQVVEVSERNRVGRFEGGKPHYLFFEPGVLRVRDVYAEIAVRNSGQLIP
jgi:hypothetical protein